MAGERLLIVEDEGIVAADLESLLQKLGYVVVGAVATGEEAVVKAEELVPQLVLMDIRLKGEMDGIDAAEQISARFNIPVTYLTAYADEKTLDRAKTTMPYGYILKPFQERDLRTAVELALYKHKMESVMASIDGWHATTLRSMPEAVVATDKNGHITFMNTRAESLAGWKFQDAWGKSVESVLPLRRLSTSQPVSMSIPSIMDDENAPSSDEQFLLSAKDGSQTRVHFRAVPSKDDQGMITGAIIAFHDLSKEKTSPMASGNPRA